MAVPIQQDSCSQPPNYYGNDDSSPIHECPQAASYAPYPRSRW